MIELVVAVSAAVAISAMCSLFEAVLYSVPVSHIESMAESGRPTGRILKSLRDQVDRPIAAILSLNTIANTAGAAVAGAAAASVFADGEILGFSILGLWFPAAFTLAILVLSEVIPKTVGVVYARGLAAFIARPLMGLVWTFRPLIWFTGQLTRLFARTEESSVSVEEIMVMAQLGLKAGTIDIAEAAVIENILSLEGKTVRSIMTPRTVVSSLSMQMTIGDLRDNAAGMQSFNHSRVAVYESDADDVVGMVHRRDVLTAMAQGDWDRRLEAFMRPVDFVAESLTVNRLLRRLLETGQHLVMVIDEYGGLAGLVTLEDVLEEILGAEIVDEFDPAIDMRELAHRRRQESLAQAARARS